MPSVGRLGDLAGGKVMQGSVSVTANDLPIARLNSPISDHGINEHSSAKMSTAFLQVTVEDIPLCVAGNAASCGHVLISNSNVEAG